MPLIQSCRVAKGEGSQPLTKFTKYILARRRAAQQGEGGIEGSLRAGEGGKGERDV